MKYAIRYEEMLCDDDSRSCKKVVDVAPYCNLKLKNCNVSDIFRKLLNYNQTRDYLHTITWLHHIHFISVCNEVSFTAM